MPQIVEQKEVSEKKRSLDDYFNNSHFLNGNLTESPNQQKWMSKYTEKESKFYRWACNCIWAGCIAGPAFTMANVFILDKYFPQWDNFGYGQDIIPFVLGSFLEGAVISGTAYNICRHNKRVQPKVSHAYQQAKNAVKFTFREGINNAKIIKKSVEKTLASAYHYLF